MFIIPNIAISVQNDSGKKKIKVCDKHLWYNRLHNYTIKMLH